jgi:O-acetyl-ADP-ribose deacetylase (regulator of RNase III)
VVVERRIRSIAVPPLGCGQGGLAWADVHPLIEAAFSDLDGVHALVFVPGEGPP